MLSINHRFHGYNSLNYVYKRGRIVRGPYCSMKFVPSKHDDYRVSVVVSKKIAKSAPDRNRIRRRVYEAIRLQIDEYKIKQDIVVTVFNDKFLSASHDELTKAIKSQLAEIAQQA